MKRATIALIIAGLFVALVIWRFGINARQKRSQIEAASTRRKAPPTVRVAAATVRDIVRTFQGIGSVEAPFNVRIGAKVTGRLVYLEAREGDRVAKGQVLA